MSRELTVIDSDSELTLLVEALRFYARRSAYPEEDCRWASDIGADGGETARAVLEKFNK